MGNKKLSRNELVKHILDTMPRHYNEYERLAFIELKVAEQIAFDERYLWSDLQTKERIYKAARREADKPRAKVDKKLICITMSELFAYVLKAVGFNVEFQKQPFIGNAQTVSKGIFKKISHKTQEHVRTVVQLSNGKKIEVDIQGDLHRLQTRSRPKFFGQVIHETGITTLPSHLLDETFRKLYGIKENECFIDQYIRDFIRQSHEEQKTSIQTIEMIMNDQRIQEQLQSLGCIETNKILQQILYRTYGIQLGKQYVKEKEQAIMQECALIDDSGMKRFSFCVYAEDEQKKIFYIYSKKSKKMIKLTREDLQQMKKTPKKVEIIGKSTELKQHMTRYINDDTTEPSNKENEPKDISIDDIFLE